ncbi:hypothetical protein V8F33_008542 [Rhypophila sp. PSN 637]
MYLRRSLNLLSTLISMPMVLSFPLSELEQIKTLNERQGTPLPWILNGTCIVSTNICTVDWWLSNPPTTANYVCGRYSAPGITMTNPGQGLPL